MRLLRAIVLFAVAMLGCSDQNVSTASDTPSHIARVTGVARSTVGMPLDSTSVRVIIPSPSRFGYATIVVHANARGEFDAPVWRLNAAYGVVPTPDTVTAILYGSTSKARYRTSTSVDGTSEVSLLLTFVPSGQTPSVQRLDLRFAPRD